MALLVRPANVVTAIADVFAGMAIVGYLSTTGIEASQILPLALLCLATSGLYAGGIIFNDVFDIAYDKVNRPERVIPSGKVSLKNAIRFGIVLFGIGICAASLVSLYSGLIATAIMLSALLYDAYGKHNSFFGPINMGLCRGLNLILGMSVAMPLSPKYYAIGLLPIVFVAAITLTAQKETKGKNKLAIAMAMCLDMSILLGFWIISKYFKFSLKHAILFLLLWYAANTFAKTRALVKNTPKHIMHAVKIAVLSLIPLNATYVAGFSSVFLACLTLMLLPISLFLAKKFPVT